MRHGHLRMCPMAPRTLLHARAQPASAARARAARTPEMDCNPGRWRVVVARMRAVSGDVGRWRRYACAVDLSILASGVWEVGGVGEESVCVRVLFPAQALRRATSAATTATTGCNSARRRSRVGQRTQNRPISPGLGPTPQRQRACVSWSCSMRCACGGVVVGLRSPPPIYLNFHLPK